MSENRLDDDTELMAFFRSRIEDRERAAFNAAREKEFTEPDVPLSNWTFKYNTFKDWKNATKET